MTLTGTTTSQSTGSAPSDDQLYTEISADVVKVLRVVLDILLGNLNPGAPTASVEQRVQVSSCNFPRERQHDRATRTQCDELNHTVTAFSRTQSHGR